MANPVIFILYLKKGNVVSSSNNIKIADTEIAFYYIGFEI